MTMTDEKESPEKPKENIVFDGEVHHMTGEEITKELERIRKEREYQRNRLLDEIIEARERAARFGGADSDSYVWRLMHPWNQEPIRRY